MRLASDLFRQLIEHLSPVTEDVKLEATLTSEATQHAVEAREEAERQLGISFGRPRDVAMRRNAVRAQARMRRQV